MAVADRAAVVSWIEELSDDSILQEARSCGDEEFLLFLLIRERQRHLRTENYFERIKLLYIVLSRTAVSCLERLLATCLSLPHGQRNGGRPAIDLQNQVLITIWILGKPKCLRSVADGFNIRKSILLRVYRRICGTIAKNFSVQDMKYLLV